MIANIENVFYRYPREKKWALEGVSLSIEEGRFLAVMGETGAGKTTFCRLFNGIIPHSIGGRLLGTVTIDGLRTDESSVPCLALKTGMVLDDPDAQLFTSSVRREAAFGPENLLLPPEEIEERVQYALAAAGLAGFEQRRPSTLSGGEKQRLAIAAALAMKGKILVLDEPLSRLDPQGAADVMSVLMEIRRKYQVTVVMAAHESAMMAEFADDVCILKDGRVAAFDTAGNIFADCALLEYNGIQPPDRTDISAVFTVNAADAPDRKTASDKEAPPAIEITDFCYSYGSGGADIANINLSIADNDFAAIVGSNGCGKTTLLKCITGLLHPSGGKILIRGKDTNKLSVSDISKEAGFVMQNPQTQLFTDSIYGEVSFALGNSGLSKTEIHQRVEEAIMTAGLEDPGAFPHALRRADCAKTVLACVLAMGCKIIILDEADAGQDYRGSRHIMNIVKELHSRGFTIVFVTHNMSLVTEYAHRLIVMDRNGITADKMRKDYAQ